jgi:asparagine synthase (glutamine-hydrolysing)
MCGIAGIVKQNAGKVDPDLLTRMVKRLAHRGPDAHGVYTSNKAGLAHARLSIIDLEGGSQPMSTVDGRYHISFNGEIFNYVELREELIGKGHIFTTRSDTEVILHLYQEEGECCVNRLNGQWAFAIWDSLQEKLFASRDRMGVRPFFYTRTKDSFIFASEIKAIFESNDVSRELDLRGLDQIFTFWVTLAPHTAFRNILQLPPGHSLVFQNGQLSISRYWEITYAPLPVDSIASERQLACELLELMIDATRIRLRSDVPVGAYLSGGLDSTFITALTKNLVGENLRTFSVSFEDREFDESGYQQEACTYLKTQHSNVHCHYSDIAAAFSKVVWHAEQPVLRTAPAPLYLLAQLVHQSDFKVVLTGEGADEIFGGYDILKESKIRKFWARRPDSSWRPLLLKRLYPYMAGIQRQPAPYLKNFFRIESADVSSPFFSHLPRWELTSKIKLFLSREVKAELRPDEALSEMEEALPKAFNSWGEFNRAEYFEAKYLLPGYILSSQGDRMSMAHSVEARYPFLDHRVVQFAANLPPMLKMKVLDQKHLLKLAASGLIPETIRNRYKQPYRAPDSKSFVYTSLPHHMDLLSTDALKKFGIFDPISVNTLLGKLRKGTASVKDDMALVGILSTQLLLDQFACRSFLVNRPNGHLVTRPQPSTAQ